MKHADAWFTAISNHAGRLCGHPLAFVLAVVSVVVWAVTGPLFGFSDTWQLVINTGTTVLTFLLLFVVQNSQMRNDAAIHAKLDELIHVSESARDELIQAETQPEQEIDRIRQPAKQSIPDPPGVA